jgi:hypothetical protein
MKKKENLLINGCSRGIGYDLFNALKLKYNVFGLSSIKSKKNNNYWLLVIDECYKHRDTYVLLSTGPQLISKIYKGYPQLVHVLPYPIFNPPPWDAHSDNVKCKHYNTVMW